MVSVMSSGWAGGHARHLRRCDKEPPGAKRRGGAVLQQNHPFRIGGGPSPALPPARSGRQWRPFSRGIRRSALDRSARDVSSRRSRWPVSCRAGGRAGMRDISADATRILQAKASRGAPPAKRSFSHRGRSLACPSARPLGTTMAIFVARVSALSLDRCRPAFVSTSRWPVSCRAGGRAGMRDISADAIKNLQAQSVAGAVAPAKRSFSHRGRSLACPSAHPLGTTRADVLCEGGSPPPLRHLLPDPLSYFVTNFFPASRRLLRSFGLQASP